MSNGAREEHLKAEVTPWNGEENAEARDMELDSGEKIAGRDFSLCLEYNMQRLQKQVGGSNRRGGDEEAAKDGHHERSDKENYIKRKHGCQKTVGGSRSCLRRIVRKHGRTQDGRIPCRNGMNGWST